MPPIWPKIGLSLVTFMEFTANQSRNPVGNGTSSPADIVEIAPNEIKIPTTPEMRQSLRSTVFLLDRSVKCENAIPVATSELRNFFYPSLSLKPEPNRHRRRVPLR